MIFNYIPQYYHNLVAQVKLIKGHKDPVGINEVNSSFYIYLVVLFRKLFTLNTVKIFSSSTNNSDWEYLRGVALTPGIGWKIDVGEPGGFFIQAGIKVPVTFGTTSYSKKPDKEFGANFSFRVYFGMGYAFGHHPR